MTRSTLTRPWLLLALPLLLAAPGCKWKKEAEQLKTDNQRLVQEKQQLEKQVQQTGGETAEMNATLDEVQKSLEDLRATELKVISNSIEIAQEGKPKRARREALKQEIDEIRAAITKNLEKLSALEKEKKAAQKQSGTLQRLVDELRNSLEEKQQTIAQLEEKVLQMSQTIEQQAGTIKERESTIDTQVKELNKGYVLIAGKKELKAKGLVEKKGSVLGLGGSFRRTGKFDPDTFREIDTTQETSFAMNAPAKKIRVLSDHPKESYQLSDDGAEKSKLTITDAPAFWRGSKYLVVMTPD
jgi:predicted  nucleic acid-binding Zn-ribbon protein